MEVGRVTAEEQDGVRHNGLDEDKSLVVLV